MGIFTQFLVQGDAVVALIPQKPPIVMVDILYECTAEGAVAGLTIRADNMFCNGTQFCESGILEHMAQSIALKAGYEHRGAPPVIGFIASLKHVKIYFLPVAGDQLICTVRQTHLVGNISVWQGNVMCGDKTVASCEMKIATSIQQE